MDLKQKQKCNNYSGGNIKLKPVKQHKTKEKQTINTTI